MTKVIGYVRCSAVSSVNDGQTIPRQIELIKAYCQLKSLPEPEFIVDEAISGAKENRPGLQQLLSLCRTNQVATVIVTDLSRLARNLRLTLEAIDLFVKQGITFVSLNEDVRTDTSMGKFFVSLCAAFNEMYRNSISERQKIFVKHKRLKSEKLGGHIPYGFVVSGKKLIADAKEQAVIAKIISYRKLGYSYQEISNALYESGIPTKTGKSKWTTSAISKILSREDSQERILKLA